MTFESRRSKVDGRKSTVESRRSKVDGRVWALAVVLWVGACGGAQPPPEPAALQVIADPSAAQVYVDDRFVGTARVLAERPARLRAGAHLMTVVADGYFPHDAELTLAPGLTTVRIALRPIPN